MTGLVIHTSATEIGRLTRSRMAAAAAGIIWNGIGTKAMNRPTAKAPEAERRFRCHRLGSCSSVPNRRKCLCSRILWGSGRYRLIYFFAINYECIFSRNKNNSQGACHPPRHAGLSRRRAAGTAAGRAAFPVVDAAAGTAAVAGRPPSPVVRPGVFRGRRDVGQLPRRHYPRRQPATRARGAESRRRQGGSWTFRARPNSASVSSWK